MTPSRQEWRGKYSNPKAIKVQEYNTFGWTVHQHIMPQDSKLIFTSSSDVARQSAPNLTLYVKGMATIGKKLEDGSFDMFLDRVPGMYSGDRGDHPAGVVILSAVQETEFWCFNWHANRRGLPLLTPIRSPNGGNVQTAVGKKILVCSGTINGFSSGQSFITQSDILNTSTSTYAFEIERGRDETV
jgi:hypothetical protein